MTEIQSIEPKLKPLAPAAIARGTVLSERPMSPSDIAKVIIRRCLRAKIPCYTPHSFRVTAITEFLKNGGKIEDAKNLARHESITTTALYDRREMQSSLDQIWRIKI
jgi:integrase